RNKIAIIDNLLMNDIDVFGNIRHEFK
ncbi:MAG: hypothetical protein ACI94Y_002997, partial [Maribacter sp.]